MAISQEYINETVTQIAAMPATAAVQAIFAKRGDDNELTT